ncbi:hypothetical protein TNCV_4015181 [Trichonephila clavipes]|nr:hypothetical protein TNCV_4015181 [Trichonephila clavipes]
MKLCLVHTCFERHKRFSGGKESVEDYGRTGSPSSAITDKNIAKIRGMSGFPLTSGVSQLHSIEVLKRFRGKIRKKKVRIGKRWMTVLHQHNASVHKALSVKQFLTSKNITLMGHPSYSSDLASCDVLFLTVKSCLKGELA